MTEFEKVFEAYNAELVKADGFEAQEAVNAAWEKRLDKAFKAEDDRLEAQFQSEEAVLKADQDADAKALADLEAATLAKFGVDIDFANPDLVYTFKGNADLLEQNEAGLLVSGAVEIMIPTESTYSGPARIALNLAAVGGGWDHGDSITVLIAGVQAFQFKNKTPKKGDYETEIEAASLSNVTIVVECGASGGDEAGRFENVTFGKLSISAIDAFSE